MDVKRIVSAGGGFPFAIASVLVVATALAPLRSVLPIESVMLVLVPVIIGIALVAGVRASATAAVVAFIALDLTFTPPYYQLGVGSAPALIGLFVFLAVALITGRQAGRLRSRERAALQRQSELELLNRLSFRIASETSAAATAEFIVRQMAEVLDAPRAAMYALESATPVASLIAEAGKRPAGEGEAAFVEWVVRTSKAVGAFPSKDVPYDQRIVSVSPSEAAPGLAAEGVFLPLQTSTSLEGVLFVGLGSNAGPSADETRVLSAVANLAAASLERQRLSEEAAHAQALREAGEMKTTLVSSVSHELKTPLAAATARVTGLLEEGEDADRLRVRTELASVADDLGRLNASIGDLLDLSRLESDEWKPRFEDHDLADILGTVRSRLSASQRDRVRFDLAEDLPMVRADFAQLARAITNVVENALVYSPESGIVMVGAVRSGASVELWVEDRGPGVSEADRPHVFDKFYRGAVGASAPAGTGLGLAIAREIVAMHGGSIRVEDAVPSGARFVVSLPPSTEENA